VPEAQSIRTKMIEGHLGGMSFTYDAVKSYMGEVAGKAVRYLQELKLYEATVTPFPMNTLAVASAKSEPATEPPPSLDFGQFAGAMQSALAITFEPARKAAVDILAAAYRPAAGLPDEEVTADAAAPDDDGDTAETKASSYALDLIHPSGPRDGAPDPLAALKMAQDAAEADRLEAQITTAQKG
jgi:Caudovirus prohead serine protease